MMLYYSNYHDIMYNFDKRLFNNLLSQIIFVELLDYAIYNVLY